MGSLKKNKLKWYKSNFTTYKQAISLLKLGFVEDCVALWVDGTLDLSTGDVSKYPEKYVEIIPASFKSQAFDFFEEKYQIFISRNVYLNSNEILGIIYTVSSIHFPSFEVKMTLEECLTREKAESKVIDSIIAKINTYEDPK